MTATQIKPSMDYRDTTLTPGVTRRVPKVGYATNPAIASGFAAGIPAHAALVDPWTDRIQEAGRLDHTSRVLDMGCGIGRFAIPLARKLGCTVIGADFSGPMLDQAGRRAGADLVTWDRQVAGQLTYPDETFDAIFMSNLLHHVDNPLLVIRDCFRVLKPWGVLLVRHGAIDQIKMNPEHVFFPETVLIDRVRVLSTSAHEEQLRAAGFTDVTSVRVDQQAYLDAEHLVHAIRHKESSALCLIPDIAFAAGLARLVAYANAHPDDPWLTHDQMTMTLGRKAHNDSP